MTSNLEQQAREALMRALPHLTPRRRELVLSALMSNPSPNDWYDSWHQTTLVKNAHELEQCTYYICIYMVTKSDPKKYEHWVSKLNKLIDTHEPQNP